MTFWIWLYKLKLKLMPVLSCKSTLVYIWRYHNTRVNQIMNGIEEFSNKFELSMEVIFNLWKRKKRIVKLMMWWKHSLNQNKNNN